VHSLKGISHHGAGGFGRQTLAPVFANQAVEQLRVGIPFQRREADPADQLVVRLDGSEGKIAVIFRFISGDEFLKSLGLLFQ